jgi:hypothetical protein
MNTGTVELKFQDGTAIKIKGSADFVAAVTTAILEVGKGKSGEHIHVAQIKESFQAGKWPIVILSRITSRRRLRIIPRQSSLAG